MTAVKLKLALSALILAAILSITPMFGLTAGEQDERAGVMIDFGYYDVDWVEMSFAAGMSGSEALDTACHIRGYELKRDQYGSVTSVNGDANLINAVWGMYVLDPDGRWQNVPEPDSYEVGSERIVAWARASDVDSMMPAVDSTGHTYYSYADGGRNAAGDAMRVITLAPSVTETLVAIGGIDCIVGTDLYSNYPYEIVERQQRGDISFVGGYTDPNYERIVGMAPDLVILDGSVGEHVSMADKLRKSGFNCAVLYEVRDMKDLMKNMWIAASAIGFSEKGNQYNRALASTVDSICGTAQIHSNKVFISLGTTDSPYTSGSGTFIDSMIRMSGCDNIFSDGTGWYMVNKEQIYNGQPDTILIIYEEGEITNDREYKRVLRSLNSMWKDTPAFEEKNVLIFSGDAADLLSRPGARLGAALELIAKMLDPDSFLEVDYWDRVPKYVGDDYADYLKYQAEGLLS